LPAGAQSEALAVTRKYRSGERQSQRCLLVTTICSSVGFINLPVTLLSWGLGRRDGIKVYACKPLQFALAELSLANNN
jgi:hypothetical protein